MAGEKQQVILTPTTWNEEAAMLLQGAAGNDPTYTMDDLRREVMDGDATLYGVSLGPDRLGYVVLWIDDFGRTKELVIQAGEAFQAHKLAARVTLPALREFARSRGCATMRTHVTAGSRYIRALREFGFRKTEYVLKAGV
nr:hypothetical protein 10 [Moraxellaceae bacterium]